MHHLNGTRTNDIAIGLKLGQEVTHNKVSIINWITVMVQLISDNLLCNLLLEGWIPKCTKVRDPSNDDFVGSLEL